MFRNSLTFFVTENSTRIELHWKSLLTLMVGLDVPTIWSALKLGGSRVISQTPVQVQISRPSPRNLDISIKLTPVWHSSSVTCRAQTAGPWQLTRLRLETTQCFLTIKRSSNPLRSLCSYNNMVLSSIPGTELNLLDARKMSLKKVQKDGVTLQLSGSSTLPTTA